MRTQRKLSGLRCRLLLLILFSAAPFLCRAQDQYKNIEPAELLRTPQKYWARAIVFKDTLTQPPSSASVDIEGKRYAVFSTRDVGTCYASAELLPGMSDAEVDREYLFSGTVFQHRGRYVPVVQSYTPAVDAKELSADMKTVAEEMPGSFTNQAVRPMADLLAAVQSAQLAYAKEKNIPLCQLYDPTSEHYVKAMDLARTAIYKSEQKNNTASAEILAQYLSTVLARQCAPGTETQAVDTAESISEPEEPLPSEKAEEEDSTAPPATNVAPKKLSWSERWAAARATKEAERKAKQERDAEQAAEEAARKAADEYQAQQKEENQAAEIATEAPAPAAEAEIQEAQEDTSPATNEAPAVESSAPQPAKLSWFQRWKKEREKQAAIHADKRRIEQEQEAVARQRAAEKKAAEKKRLEEKKTDEMRKKLEAERTKAESKKAKAEAEAKKNDFYAPVAP